MSFINLQTLDSVEVAKMISIENSKALEPNHFWENQWFIELCGGILTSVLLFLFMRTLRPNIKLCPKISHDEDGKYVLKMINSTLFNVTDLKFNLKFIVNENAPGGNLVNYKNVKLAYNNCDNIPARFDKNAKSDALYAHRVDIECNLIDEWEKYPKNTKLVFTVQSKHGLSGICRIKSEIYNHKSIVKKGNFKSGNTFDIEPFS